ncbi:MAG: response regulator transcription factor [Ilumatobacter sp.]|uniref:response regulator transcription factor n=1 Tax=Ilumatobacter sp. TaxID=1967498 RepID=UPI002603D57E|nr:response regulator transcription factor [Ilumatobacter sp.]MDJ0771388.1 response regulator transcription factor [Ilumatobacter sp.]
MNATTNATTTLLVAEDDLQVREALERILGFEGYEVVSVTDGAAALEAIDATAPDAIVLDVMMPLVDGLDVCRRLRARGDRTPVLMLTARDEISDRVAGLDAGADDYLPKPFALEELLARLRALLRRSQFDGDGADAADRTLTFEDIELDLAGRVVRRGDRVVELTRTEFQILELLMRHPGVVLDRMTMYTEIWGYEGETSSKALDVHTRYVRRKLEAGGEPRLLHTVHGVGYVLRRAPDGAS